MAHGQRASWLEHHRRREYWSPRPGYPMATPGREAKRLTHRLERRHAKRQVRRELQRAMEEP